MQIFSEQHKIVQLDAMQQTFPTRMDHAMVIIGDYIVFISSFQYSMQLRIDAIIVTRSRIKLIIMSLVHVSSSETKLTLSFTVSNG